VGNVVIGSRLAAELGIDVGDRVILQAARTSGHVGTGSRTVEAVVVVRGIFTLGVQAIDERVVYLELAAAKRLFDVADGVSIIEVKVDDVWQAPELANRLGRATHLRASQWLDRNTALQEGLTAQATTSNMIKDLSLLTIAIGVASALLLSVSRRRGDRRPGTVLTAILVRVERFLPMRVACERLGISSAVVAVWMACACASNGPGGSDASAGASTQDGSDATVGGDTGREGNVGSVDGGPGNRGGGSSSGTGTTSSGGGSSSGTGAASSGGGSSSGTGTTSSGGGADASSATAGDEYDWDVAPRTPAPHPAIEAGSCGSWAAVDNVCCGQYCSDDDTSGDCSKCAGTSKCVPVSSKGCISGAWPEVHSVSDNESWHYSRSTHFGETTGGACQFGYYGVCSSSDAFNKTMSGCEAFCSAYPDLCAEPDGGVLLRGNFAAPSGYYYSQFWSSLPGDDDNYLSCGECFELVRTKNDGTDYQPTDPNYTAPILLQVVDSCPCAPNSKWCCGSGRDHCGEIEPPAVTPGFTYGCPLPPAPPTPAADHDPLPNESIHLDLSDVAMARLQSGSITGNMPAGVVPTRYRRVPCPVPGNIYLRMMPNAGDYYFALTVVNVRGLGSVIRVEAELPSGDWVSLVRDQNYTRARPQERSGDWVIPQGAGPFSLPVTIRITDASGMALVAANAIKSWTPTNSTAPADGYYIDTGVQF